MANPFALIGSAPGMVGGYGLPQAPAMVPTVNPTPAAAPAGVAQPKLSFWDKLDGFFGGDIGNALDAIRKRKAASGQQQQLLAAINALPPDERALALADLPKWAAAREKQMEPYTLSEGQERGVNGKVIQRARKTVVGVDGGYGYTGNDEDGVGFGAQRPISHAEENTSDRNDLMDKLNAIREQLGWANVGVRQDRNGVLARQGDERLGQSAQRLPGANKPATDPLAAIEAELRRRGKIQ